MDGNKVPKGDVLPKRRWRYFANISFVAFAFILTLIFLGFFFGPMDPGAKKTRESSAMQTTRTIALAMFQYANDNGGNYPTGSSSTEVFQKLVDGNYISDPAILYLEMPGKKPASTTHLAPENVCFDVTMPTTADTPDTIPLVFVTGYRVEYKLGGMASPLSSARPDAASDGFAVCYHSNNASYQAAHDPSGIVTNVIPTNGDLGQQTYTQLTPDGPLPSP